MSFNNDDFLAPIEDQCKSYMQKDDFKKGEYKDVMYKICCEDRKLCFFYQQTWFYAVCAIGGILLIIILIVIICCCCKKKGGGGKDEVFDYEDGDNSEPSDSTKNVMA